MLTIVGPGGTDKTRFAIKLARLLAEDAEGGIVFVPLAPLRDPELVLPTIAERLGASSADPEAIASRIAEKRTHLLVDNVEHLLPAAARSLAAMVAEIPALRLLTTSREALRIQGEEELDLPPFENAEAVTFFVEHAQAVRADVEPTRSLRTVHTARQVAPRTRALRCADQAAHSGGAPRAAG